MTMFKRGVFLLGLWFVAVAAVAEPLTVASNFEDDGRLAKDRGAVVLVFFTSDFCGYCARVEHDYLRPMQLTDPYRGRLLIRRVDVESSKTLFDFKGAKTDHERFAKAEAAFLTPTIRFYGSDGKELADAVVGFNTPEYYGGRLTDAIEGSLDRLKTKTAGLKP